MTKDVDLEPPLPYHVEDLTLEVARAYLLKKRWTPNEAVLIFAGLDPRNEPFFEADDAKEFWLARSMWHAVRNFRSSNQPLTVDTWLDWAVNGTEVSPRSVPFGYAKELQAALSNDFLPLSNRLNSIGAVGPSKAPSNRYLKTGTQSNWIAVARTYGQQFVDKQARSGAFPNQEVIGDHVAKRFVDEGLTTDRGKPPSGAYVKRHALKGLRSMRK